MDEIAERWGKLVRRKRTEAGLNQTELGERLGALRQPDVSTLENGKRLPGTRLQHKLIAELGITGDDLHEVYAGLDETEGVA